MISALIVAEIALALILSVNGAFFIRAFNVILSTESGIDAANVVTFTLNPPYEEPGRRQRFYRSILADLRAIRGVHAVGAADWLPPDDPFGSGSYFRAADAPEKQLPEMVPTRTVTPGYFAAMGTKLKEGREYNELDRADSVVVVNVAFANLFWPHAGSALGRQIRTQPNSKWMTVIGVSENVRNNGLDQDIRPCAYLRYDRTVPGYMSFAVRGDLDSRKVIAGARDAVRRADSGLALFDVQSMRERLDRPLWLRRASSWLLGLFSLVALALAVAGVYAIVSYNAARRTREIGIRMALGAERGKLVAAIVREGGRLLVYGTLTGVAGILITTRLIRHLLTDFDARDPVIYALVIVALVVPALLANLFPALRATSLPPTIALRSE